MRYSRLLRLVKLSILCHFLTHSFVNFKEAHEIGEGGSVWPLRTGLDLNLSIPLHHRFSALAPGLVKAGSIALIGVFRWLLLLGSEGQRSLLEWLIEGSATWSFAFNFTLDLAIIPRWVLIFNLACVFSVSSIFLSLCSTFVTPGCWTSFNLALEYTLKHSLLFGILARACHK